MPASALLLEDQDELATLQKEEAEAEEEWTDWKDTLAQTDPKDVNNYRRIEDKVKAAKTEVDRLRRDKRAFLVDAKKKYAT